MSDPWARFRVKPMGTPEDMARSAWTGLREGVAAIGGMVGDARDLGHMGGEKLAELMGAKPLTPQQQQSARQTSMLASAPTTPQVNSAVEKATGPYHQPQTTPGKYSRAVGQFAPGALMPGGPAVRAANVLAPALLSEGAGQLTEGTAAEPWARMGGALAGGVGVAGLSATGAPATRMLAEASRGANDAQIAAARELMAASQQRGIQLTLAEAMQQVTENGTGMGRLQRVLEGTRGGGERLAPVMSARPGQTAAAVNRYADALAAPSGQPSMIGARAQQGADTALNRVRQEINATAQPQYDALRFQEIHPALVEDLRANPSFAEALTDFRNNPELSARVANLPDENLAVLNEVEKYLGTRADQARPGAMNPQGNYQLSSAREEAAGRINALASELSPEWRGARDTVSQGRQQMLEPLQRGPLGVLAGTDDVKRQTGALFPSAPLEGAANETQQAMRMLGQQAPEAPSELLRQHLMNTYNEAGQALQGGQNQWGGAKYAAVLAGNPEQRRTLMAGAEAAGADADELAGLLESLAATGKRQAPGSLTAYNTEDLKSLGEAGLAGNIMSTGLNPPGAWRRMGDAFERWQKERNSAALADILLEDPATAERMMRQARARHPEDQALITELQRLALTAQQSRPRELTYGPR